MSDVNALDFSELTEAFNCWHIGQKELYTVQHSLSGAGELIAAKKLNDEGLHLLRHPISQAILNQILQAGYAEVRGSSVRQIVLALTGVHPSDELEQSVHNVMLSIFMLLLSMGLLIEDTESWHSTFHFGGLTKDYIQRFLLTPQ